MVYQVMRYYPIGEFDSRPLYKNMIKHIYIKILEKLSLNVKKIIALLPLILFLLPASSYASLSIDATSTIASSAVSSLTISTHNINASADYLACNIEYAKTAERSISSLTHGGTPLTQIIKATTTESGEFIYSEVWGLSSPSVGTSDIVLTLDGSASAGLACASLFSTSDFVSVANSTTSIESGTTPSISIPSTSGDLGISGVASLGDPTIQLGFQIMRRIDLADLSLGGSWASSGSTSTDMSWTLGVSHNSAMAGVAFTSLVPATEIILTRPADNSTTTNPIPPFQFWAGTYDLDATTTDSGIIEIQFCYQTGGCLANLINRQFTFFDTSSTLNWFMPLDGVLSNGEWTATAILYDSNDNIMASSTPITFNITGGGVQTGIIYEDCSAYQGGLFSSSTLGGIFCNVNNSVKKTTDFFLSLPSVVATGISDTANGLVSTIRNTFPISLFSALNDDFQLAQATTTAISISLGGNGTFGGHTFIIANSSSGDVIKDNTGFDLREFERKMIWGILGIIMVMISILSFRLLFAGGGQRKQ